MRKLYLKLLLVPLAVTGILLTLTGRNALGQDTSQSARQDMKAAGRNSKRAAKDTARATKKTAKKGVHASAKAVDKGSRKVERKTAPQS